MSNAKRFSKFGWVGILLFILVAILQGFFRSIGEDIYNLMKEWIPNLPLTIPDLLSIMLLVLGIILIIIDIKRKPTFEKKDEPNFDHIEAWFFYSKKYSWGKGERDPKKHVPRQKLVLLKDLKKAYYMGEYALNLVLNDKIKSSLTDNEQDNLHEWCNARGYDLIPNDGTKDRLLEPYFKAEIKDKKSEYHPRDIVLFRTHYRGKLTNGFYHNEIVHSENKKFPSGTFHRLKNHDYSRGTDTLSNRAKWKWFWFIKGKLNGYVNYSSEWSWIIPYNAPKGKYHIKMCVYNWNSVKTVVEQKEETIVVV